MGTLSVWRFDTPGGADEAVATLEELTKQRLITVHDAATVRWEEGARKPKARQLLNLAGAGALGGAFWGLMFGLSFLVHLLGAVIGGEMGAVSGSLSDSGLAEV